MGATVFEDKSAIEGPSALLDVYLPTFNLIFSFRRLIFVDLSVDTFFFHFQITQCFLIFPLYSLSLVVGVFSLCYVYLYSYGIFQARASFHVSNFPGQFSFLSAALLLLYTVGLLSSHKQHYIMRNKVLVPILFRIALSSLVLLYVESKRRRNLSYEEEKTHERLEEAYTIITSTYLILLAPVVLKFLYSVLTDPALPGILRALMKLFRSEITGYIGARSERT